MALKYFSADAANPSNGTDGCRPVAADMLRVSLMWTKTPKHSRLDSSLGRLSARLATLLATAVKSRYVTTLCFFFCEFNPIQSMRSCDVLQILSSSSESVCRIKSVSSLERVPCDRSTSKSPLEIFARIFVFTLLMNLLDTSKSFGSISWSMALIVFALGGWALASSCTIVCSFEFLDFSMCFDAWPPLLQAALNCSAEGLHPFPCMYCTFVILTCGVVLPLIGEKAALNSHPHLDFPTFLGTYTLPFAPASSSRDFFRLEFSDSLAVVSEQSKAKPRSTKKNPSLDAFWRMASTRCLRVGKTLPTGNSRSNSCEIRSKFSFSASE